MSKEHQDWMPSADRLNEMLIYMINTYTDEKYGASGDFETIKEDIMSATGMSEAHFEAIQDELDFVAFAKEEQESHLDENIPIVVRTLDDLENYLKDNGWHLSGASTHDELAFLVSKTTPGGTYVDFTLAHNGDAEMAIDELRWEADTFDVDKFVYARLLENPSLSLKTKMLREEAKLIKEMLRTLAYGVSFGEKTVDERLSDAAAKCEALNNGAQGKEDIEFGKG